MSAPKTILPVRAGDAPSNPLAARLRELPFEVDRLKTGTPPRIDGKTIDYQRLQAQPGDQPLPVFSFMGSVSDHPQQVNCHITYTNNETHDFYSRLSTPVANVFGCY